MKKIFLIAFLFLHTITGVAQVVDTLPPAYKSADTKKVLTTGSYTITKETFKSTVGPTGEADIIKYIQTLPGIASGADGTGAMYARGGNSGNNLITLDGVPVWGSGHLLGLTTSFPSGIVEKSDFYIGGFESEDWNVSSSLLKIKTNDGDFNKIKTDVSISNFFVGGQVSSPIMKDKISIIASARISPLSLEYKALRPIINKGQSFVNDFSTNVYDIYAKGTYKINTKNKVSLLVFHSRDSYMFEMNEKDRNSFKWHNLIVNGQWDRQLPAGLGVRFNLTYNCFGNVQSQQVGEISWSDCASSNFIMHEFTGNVQFSKSLSKKTTSKFGVRVKYETFSQTGTQNDGMLQTTINGQMEWKEPDMYDIRLSGRLNVCLSQARRAPQVMVDPDISFMWRQYFGRTAGMEVTLDCVTQYYHTLEGIPMGWSIDMIVPPDKYNKPEHTAQGYWGLFGDYGKHHITLGGYYKYMKNLTYYKDAKSFFNSLKAGWKDNIELGTGTSYGAEFMYEKQGETVSYKISYTWSKTDRIFQSINRGKPFPAKFDRRHIGNFTFSWKFFDNGRTNFSYVTLFTYQSGNWETTRDGKIPVWMQFSEKIEGTVPLISSANNFEMPPLIRWDNNIQMEFNSGKIHHDLCVGIYNTLNRHNAAFLYYSTKKDRWETMALVPIMPFISYKISF